MSSEDPPRRYDDHEDITEEYSFDELAKGLADGTLSRRRALKLVAGALLGGSLLALFPGAAGASEASQESNLSVGGGGGGRRRRRRRRRRRGGGGGGGGVGCPPNTTLVAGQCCPEGRACGDICCAEGQGCLVPGVCD